METLIVKQFTSSPLQIVKKRIIKAPIERVWEIVADHKGMTQWMPMIKHVDLVKADDDGKWGQGCERHCQFGGDLLKEKIVHWDPPYGYAYMIEDMHLVKDHLAYIKLSKTGGSTEVVWEQYYTPNGIAPQRWIARNIMLPTVMAKALKNLTKKAA
ncbi:MAG: SRPBCC family protein [Bacteroidota bacterium]